VTTFVTDTRSNSAMISTKFLTKEQEDVPDLQAAFRDAKHTVRGNKVGSSPDKSGAFPVAADLNIKLGAAKVDDPRRTPKAKAPVKAPAKATKPSPVPEPSPAPSPPSGEPPQPAADSTSPVLPADTAPPTTGSSEPAAKPEPAAVPETKSSEPVPAEPASTGGAK
jgi:hypothetical protein